MEPFWHGRAVPDPRYFLLSSTFTAAAPSPISAYWPDSMPFDSVPSMWPSSSVMRMSPLGAMTPLMVSRWVG
jgi:hypothetical protein